MSDGELQKIGLVVAEAAYDIFCECGYENDFCIQSVGYNSAVFGGANRIIFNPLRGFRADRAYCCEKFLREFDAKYAK